MPSRLKKVLSSVGLYGPARHLARLPFRQISEYRTQINGVQVRFDTRDPRSNAWFFPRYRNGRLHEAPITRLLIEELQDKRCFIDIGAHIGWYACVAATVFSDLRVVAFEMDGSTADQLETNARFNDISIEVHRLAVIDQPGTVSYECPTDRPFSENRIAPDASSPNRRADATSLDAFVAEHSIRPDIIKIDVEGAELMALRGMKNTIQELRPTIFVEVHPENLPLFGSSTEEVTSFLTERGYEISSISHKLKPTVGQPEMLVARPTA